MSWSVLSTTTWCEWRLSLPAVGDLGRSLRANSSLSVITALETAHDLLNRESRVADRWLGCLDEVELA